MTGWIVYDRQGAARNEWFISSFIQTAGRYGVDLSLKVVSGVDDFTGVSLPDFAIVRTIAPQINKFFEENCVPVFNNYQTSKIANDKWQTYQLCKELSIPVMKTELLVNSAPTLNFPFVLKSLNGHGGSEVFLIRNRQVLDERLTAIDESNFLAQEFCSCPGKDMRVYVLGKEIVCGVLRSSQTDFRSNFSLGGEVCVCEVSPKQKEVICKLQKTLGFDLVGVDFIFHEGEWVLNEIEDVVGTRMLYSCTDINIVDLYMRHILSRLS